MRWLAVAVPLVTGCAVSSGVADAFPPWAAAHPWVRTSEAVWSGTPDEAAGAIDETIGAWPTVPERVWLAVYRHADFPERTMTVRAFAFVDEEGARTCFAHLRPEGAAPYAIGDDGAWIHGGVLFRLGPVVWDVFGRESSWSDQLQASYLAALVVRRWEGKNRDSGNEGLRD